MVLVQVAREKEEDSDDEELTNLLEGFVVDEARGVFGDIELSSLDLLAKLPVRQNTITLTHWCLSRILQGSLSAVCQRCLG
jgi:hypothetical protein